MKNLNYCSSWEMEMLLRWFAGCLNLALSNSRGFVCSKGQYYLVDSSGVVW